ncbi:hypothetical protein [Evtepia sp.]|uniref:hypothetical protein n=1 Tax=Evtepia sp. TaxID=2773933 RepID=UPI003F165804
MAIFGKKKKTPRPAEFSKLRTYDYSTPEARVATAEWLFTDAKTQRAVVEQEWELYNDYYNFIRNVTDEVRDFAREKGIQWDAAVIPDPWIMVESQIDPKVPEPEFRGRDDDMDSQKAKEREFAVKYILDANRIEDKNTSNERRLKKLGDAFWKAYWDPEMMCGIREGNIKVIDVPPEDLYIDPSVMNDGIQSAQFIDYVYRVHKVEFWRRYHRDLEKLGLDLDQIAAGDYQSQGGLFDLQTQASEDDTIQVLEHWFKHPADSKEAPAGAVGCSIQAGGREIRYIPMYWTKTGQQGQNNLFPFVHYWCVRDENRFYNKSELYPILGLVDAADRALATAQFNDAMMGNDIILQEEDALAEGETLTNEPGAVVTLRKNAMGKVQRLGGLHTAGQSLNLMNAYMEQIQRANRNYDQNLGKETTKVTTASGLLQIRSDADSQNELKKADRNRGFERLFELLDWLALEFFDDDRTLFLGGKKEDGVEKTEPQTLTYNSDRFGIAVPPVQDAITREVVREAYTYFPRVDVTVTAGDGVARSKAATLEVLDKLAAIQPNQQNYKILSAMLDILDIPQKQEIQKAWEEQFHPTIPAELQQALAGDPELMQVVMELAAENQVGAEAQGQVQGAGQMPDLSSSQMVPQPMGGEIR